MTPGPCLLAELVADEAVHVEAGGAVRWIVALRLLVVLGLAGNVAELSRFDEGTPRGEDAHALGLAVVVPAAADAGRDEGDDVTAAGLAASFRVTGPRDGAGVQDTRIVTHAPHDGQGAETLR